MDDNRNLGNAAATGITTCGLNIYYGIFLLFHPAQK
jgi:hypothetical protein